MANGHRVDAGRVLMMAPEQERFARMLVAMTGDEEIARLREELQWRMEWCNAQDDPALFGLDTDGEAQARVDYYDNCI